MKIRLLFIALLSILFIVGCSSQMPEIRKVDKISEGIYSDNLRVNIKKIYAWVNLMPGSKPRFNITGSIEWLEGNNYNLNNLKIKKIKIIQNNTIIYQFTPKVEEKYEGNKKSFIFSTVRGLLYTKSLDTEKNITVDLLFSDSSKEVIYKISDVKINEVH